MKLFLSIAQDYSLEGQKALGHLSTARYCYEVLFRESPCPDCPLKQVFKDGIGRGIATQWTDRDDTSRTARQNLQLVSRSVTYPIWETITEENGDHPASFLKSLLPLFAAHLTKSQPLYFLKIHSPRHETKLFSQAKGYVRATLPKSFYTQEIPPSTLLCVAKGLSKSKAHRLGERLRTGGIPHTSIFVVEANLATLQALQTSGPTLTTLLELSRLPGLRVKKHLPPLPPSSLRRAASLPAGLVNGQAVSHALHQLVVEGEHSAAQFFTDFIRGLSPESSSDLTNRENILLEQIHDLDFLLKLVGHELLSARHVRVHELRDHASFEAYCEALGISPATADTLMQIALQPHHLTMVEHTYHNTGKHRTPSQPVLKPLVLSLSESSIPESGPNPTA